MAVQLLEIGFGNFVSRGRIIAVVSPDSAPVRRLVQMAKEKEQLIDATYGRKTGAVIVCDTDHVVLSALSPAAIMESSEVHNDGK